MKCPPCGPAPTADVWLPVEEITKRLNDCFRFLTGGSRRAPRWQQTLRAQIDWSYDLLHE